MNFHNIRAEGPEENLGSILIQNPLQNVVFQCKIALKRFTKAQNFRLRRSTGQKRHIKGIIPIILVKNPRRRRGKFWAFFTS